MSLRTSIAALFAILVAGCGASSALSDGVYHGRETTYRLEAPSEGWRTLDVAGQNDLAWFDERTGAIVQVNSSCSPDLDIPLVALTNHLVIGFTEREDVEPQATVSMDGREALRTHLRAKLDGVPRELLLQVLKKDGCVYDFALIAPPGAPFATSLPAFERLLAGFTTGAGSAP